MERKNVNRGFKKLRVWQDAVALYVLACQIPSDFPFELKKVASNAIDAAHSISRNASGEFHSCYESFRAAKQIGESDYQRLDHSDGSWNPVSPGCDSGGTLGGICSVL